MEDPLGDPSKITKELEKVIRNTYVSFESLLKDSNWIPIISADVKRENKVQLFQQYDDKTQRYLVMVQGVLACSASRIRHLNVDNNFNTRSQWDQDDLGGIIGVATFPTRHYGELMLVDSWIKSPFPGVSHRRFFGVQFSWSNKKKTHHDVLMCSYSHPAFPSTIPNSVEATGMTGIRIKDTGNPHQCFVSLIIHASPGGWIPDYIVSYYSERIRDRLLLWEWVATTKYVEIYGTEQEQEERRKYPRQRSPDKTK